MVPRAVNYPVNQNSFLLDRIEDQVVFLDELTVFRPSFGYLPSCARFFSKAATVDAAAVGLSAAI
jgi:hypothetical protein